MKKLLLTLLLLTLSLSLPTPFQAHGGPPYIKINGNVTQTNPAAGVSPNFNIPNEIASEPIVVKETATFEIDTSLVPFNISDLTPNDIIWEFGDGSSARGFQASHTYQKTGSLLVNLKANDPMYSTIADLESIKVNVIPNKNYPVPKAVVKVDGKTIVDPLKEPIPVSKTTTFSFDGSGSEGNISTYRWDFGDGSPVVEGQKQTREFVFTEDLAYSVFPVLRVEDSNGFYSDAVVQISYDPNFDNPTNSTNQATSGATMAKFLPIGLGVFGILFIAVVLIFLILKRKK